MSQNNNEKNTNIQFEEVVDELEKETQYIAIDKRALKDDKILLHVGDIDADLLRRIDTINTVQLQDKDYPIVALKRRPYEFGLADKIPIYIQGLQYIGLTDVKKEDGLKKVKEYLDKDNVDLVEPKPVELRKLIEELVSNGAQAITIDKYDNLLQDGLAIITSYIESPTGNDIYHQYSQVIINNESYELDGYCSLYGLDDFQRIVLYDNGFKPEGTTTDEGMAKLQEYLHKQELKEDIEALPSDFNRMLKRNLSPARAESTHEIDQFEIGVYWEDEYEYDTEFTQKIHEDIAEKLDDEYGNKIVTQYPYVVIFDVSFDKRVDEIAGDNQ